MAVLRIKTPARLTQAPIAIHRYSAGFQAKSVLSLSVGTKNFNSNSQLRAMSGYT